MLGRWDQWYKGRKKQGSFRYGSTETYKLAADFLKGLDTEDWGCGMGAYRRVHEGKYFGLDGSLTPYVDLVVDLTKYHSNVDGIIMRHVLEHNYDWEKILANAIASFNKRFCLIIFTPFVEETHEIANNKIHGVDAPDIAFRKEDIEKFFKGLKWNRSQVRSTAHYGHENIYYIEK